MESVINAPQKSIFPTTILCLSVFLLGNFFLVPEAKPIKCSSSKKIIDILSVDGNNTTIQLENGKIMLINKAKLKKGDMYCTSYSNNM